MEEELLNDDIYLFPKIPVPHNMDITEKKKKE